MGASNVHPFPITPDSHRYGEGKLRVMTLDAKPKKKTKSKPIVIEEKTQTSIMALPYDVGAFRLIPCGRKKASAIQQWLYKLNRDNAAGRVYATRFHYKKGGLLVWRMA